MRSLSLALLLAASGVSAQALCEADPAQHRAATRAPMLSEIASGDGDAQDALHAYLCAVAPEALTSTPALLRTLTLRDTVVVRLGRRVETWFFADEEQGYEKGEALYSETGPLALQPVSAEGMILGLAPAPFTDGVLTALAPPDLTAYIEFRDAEGGSLGGEYPYMSLGEQITMIQRGEMLRRDYPASPYVAATQEAFGSAVLLLASLHPIHSEGINGMWLAGVATTDFYPWSADGEALAEFARVAGTSRYAAPLAAILANPPISTTEGSMKVVVVSDAYDSREDAAARALAFLDRGIDVVGPMNIEGGWYVVYRYYPADERSADVAYDWASNKGLTPEVLTYTPEVY